MDLNNFLISDGQNIKEKRESKRDRETDGRGKIEREKEREMRRSREGDSTNKFDRALYPCLS